MVSEVTNLSILKLPIYHFLLIIYCHLGRCIEKFFGKVRALIIVIIILMIMFLLYYYLGMGTVENSTVRFGFRFCFYGSVLSRFPKRFINDISWIRNPQWNAWLNLPELVSSYILVPWPVSLCSEGFCA